MLVNVISNGPKRVILLMIILTATVEINASCGGQLSGGRGTIHSPNYPSLYNNDEYCTWTIHVDNGHLILLEFKLPFELEQTSNCAYDNVKVFDVQSDGTRNLKGTWCGTNLPPKFKSSTSEIEVKFKSDGSYPYKGFSASWNEIGSTACGGKFNTDHGTLNSPNYLLRETLPNYCIWTISVDDGYRIKLEFKAPFALKDSCNDNYVKVFDVLSNGRRNLKGTWCGSRLPPHLESTQSTLEVVFRSDGANVVNGFFVSWKKTVSRCGKTFNKAQGSFTSLNYPFMYPGNLLCRWEIDPPGGGSVVLSFNPVFEIEVEDNGSCSWDYVQIIRGGREIGKWCGKTPPPPVNSNGDKLVVIFKSDDSNGLKGFFAFWKST